jgi:hypothetical protein
LEASVIQEHSRDNQLAQESYNRNREYAIKDLARSGLTPEDIFAIFPVFPIASAFLAEAGAAPPERYIIPYFDLDGNPLVDVNGHPMMYRARQNSSEQRYTQPSKEQLGDLCLHPYFHPKRFAVASNTYAVVEGEKKYAKLLKETGIPGCAIGGCWNWKWGESDVHPHIIADIERSGAEVVLIVADGDWRKYRILTAYGGLVSGLRHHFPDKKFQIVDLSASAHKGIDDYFVAGGLWEDLPQLDLGTEIVEPARALIARYGLIPKETKSSVKIFPCEANYIALLKQHPTFSEEDLWLNEDNFNIMWNGRELSDADATFIAAHFQKYLSIPEASLGSVRTSLTAVAEERRRSPIREWLAGLVWDGKPRVNRLLIDLAHAEDNPYSEEVMRRLLLGAVARAMAPGCKFDQLTILQGPQGCGKTRFWWTLFGEGNVTDIHGMGSDKDFMMQINTRWCTNFEELDAYDRRDATQLKAIITSQEDIFRPPYGRSLVKHKRKTVMVGNTNKMEFLKEDTNRREFPIIVGNVDIDRLAAEREQIWAEAHHRWKSGERFWSEDALEWEIHKTGFKRENPYEEYLREILRVMEIRHRVEGKQVVKGIRVVHALESHVGGKVNMTIYGDAMERLGWERKQARGSMLSPPVVVESNDPFDFGVGNQKLWVKVK